MSFFGVTIEKIGSILPIEKADRIELAILKDVDFQFVVPKGKFKVGQEVVYMPLDSVLPDELVKKLGLEGRLSGSQHNRVKTIKLRGQISQGLVENVNIISECRGRDSKTITEFLGITKYEPPQVELNKKWGPKTPGTILNPLPEFLSMYDIDGCERHKDIVEELRFEPISITEKLEGMNFSYSLEVMPWHKKDKEYVCSRQRSIKKDSIFSLREKHPFWVISKKCNYKKVAKCVAQFYKKLGLHPLTVTLYGEFVGPNVQGNIYKLQEHRVYLFDIKVRYKINDSKLVRTDWYGPSNFWNFSLYADLGYVVPVLFEGHLDEFLKGQTIKEASDGPSKISVTDREGIVIRPIKNKMSRQLGGNNLILKQRSPNYLAKED